MARVVVLDHNQIRRQNEVRADVQVDRSAGNRQPPSRCRAADEIAPDTEGLKSGIGQPERLARVRLLPATTRWSRDTVKRRCRRSVTPSDG